MPRYSGLNKSGIENRQLYSTSPHHAAKIFRGYRDCASRRKLSKAGTEDIIEIMETKRRWGGRIAGRNEDETKY